MLKVSSNGRFLVNADRKQTPFFYLGDTAWELFHRTTRDEAEFYLRDRAAKGFNVIQAVLLAEFDGLTEPNREGHLPLIDNDPTRPNEEYFRFVDHVVDRIAAHCMYAGLLPTWGDKVNVRWGKGPVIFTQENAFKYGEFLGRRYKDKPVIWINGGDRIPETPVQFAIFRALAQGLASGDGKRHLQTFHPMGGRSSSDFFHSDDWLSFNTLQSSHGKKDLDNGSLIATDYAHTPAKPCLDGEPCYEDHPIDWKPENGYFDAWDVRKSAWCAVFNGACGHTYGCHDIWQFLDTERHPPVSAARTPWRAALVLPGASQMRHLRRLMESRPYLSRIPDRDLIVGIPQVSRACATRDQEGRYAFVYAPRGEALTVRLDKIAPAKTFRAAWYDPRTGKSISFGEFVAKGEREFTPPSSGDGNDWVLTLDVR